MKNDKKKWTIGIIIGIIIILLVGGIGGYNYYLDQEKLKQEAKTEQVLYEKEAAAEEQARLELEKNIAAAQQFLNEQKELWVDWLTEDHSNELSEIETQIINAKDEDEITSLKDRIDEIITEADSFKQETEEQAVLAASYNHTYSYYSGSISEEDARNWIGNRESHNNYESVGGNGSYWGRWQLSSSKLEGVDKDWLLYTEEGHAYQDEVANNYVEDRYGSWENAYSFWNNNGYY